MNNEEEGRIEALRDSIRDAFPSEIYKGQVTAYDDKLDYPEPEEEDGPDLYDEKDLFEACYGRRWTEMPTKLLYAQPDGFVLLTDQAFVAFLTAWLMQSLEDLGSENEVREFIVYAFSNTVQQLKKLNPQQRLTTRSLLAEFAEQETSQYVKNLAAQAVEMIGALRC